jgi:hypothetical protein
MTIQYREGFAAALDEAVLWYTKQLEYGPEVAEALAEKFAGAVDSTVARIAAQPDAGAVWRYRRGYRFRVVEKPFHRWLLFYRRPAEDCVELVDIVRGERDLTRKPA